MNPARLMLIGCCLAPWLSPAADLNSVGVTFLRSLDPTLQGSGVTAIHPEALFFGGFEVNPATIGQPSSLFTWLSSSGSSTSTYPNTVGGESGHADTVADAFYGLAGVAPGVAHVDNYEGQFFYDSRIVSQTPIGGKIVNQSFVFNPPGTVENMAYDNYAAIFGTLFVNGAGNSGTVYPPASSYNCIAVGAYGGSSSVGSSNGLSKPDITAPASLTSFSTPLVAGAAAVLLQAANRNDGGTATASRAGDLRTLKALLMNGAEKTQDWMHLAPDPLDPRYGAGVLNLWNSYRQLRGGKQAFNFSTANGIGAAHLPPSGTNSLPTRRGWDQNTISNPLNQEAVNHYMIDLRTATNRTFTLKATLVWLRQQNLTSINDLDLFLYNADSNTLVASSQSPSNNVEHLYLTNLPPARYDLQVLKNGLTKRITMSETYALAFEFGPPEDARVINQGVASGQFNGRVTGEPYQNYAVYRTTSFSSWTPVVTNRTSAEGSFNFSDPTGSPHRFYRTKLVP